MVPSNQFSANKLFPTIITTKEIIILIRIWPIWFGEDNFSTVHRATAFRFIQPERKIRNPTFNLYLQSNILLCGKKINDSNIQQPSHPSIPAARKILKTNLNNIAYSTLDETKVAGVFGELHE